MDYDKTRAEAQIRKNEVLERQRQIPEEIKKLSDEMERNKRELIGIEQVLDGLSFMEGDGPLPSETYGLTDSIRKILSETAIPLVPTQIRDALEARGINGSSSKNLLINVHKVLERLEEELTATKNTEGKTAYRRPEPFKERAFAAIAPPLNQLEALARIGSTQTPKGAFERFKSAHDALMEREKKKKGKYGDPPVTEET